MPAFAVYLLAAIGLFVIGLYALLRRGHFLRKILALNVMASAIFLLLVDLAHRGPGPPDPVPHALVLTGIVVSISATGLALALTARIRSTTGHTRLPDD